MESLYTDEVMADWEVPETQEPQHSHLGAQSYHSESNDDAFEGEDLRTPPPEVRPPPVTNFRLQARNLFLTYPRCNTLPGTVLERIKTNLDPEWSVVCQEHHGDGSLHLHCVIRLKKKFTTRLSDCFDYLTGKHGNYRAARSLVDVLKYGICIIHHVTVLCIFVNLYCHTIHNIHRYVTKDDQFVCYNINVKQWLAQRKSHRSTRGDDVMLMIFDGKTLHEITAMYPGYALVHRRQIKEMITEARQWSHNRDRTEWVCPTPLDCTILGCDLDQQQIIGWIRDNIRHEREFKQSALWIWGNVNKGKTSFLNWLDTSLKIYWIPKVSLSIYKTRFT